MKNFYLLLFTFISFTSTAQVFWSEDFGTGCNTGTNASGFITANGTWTVTDIAPPETYANQWYISAHTRNTGVGNCAADCAGGNNQTLHIGSAPVPLLALAAEQGSYLTGFYCSLFGVCSTTHKRVESPVIDCSGKTSVVLSAIYYEGGDVQGGLNGDCSVWYYDGTTWSMIDALAKTNNAPCNSTIYGVWTNYSISLPVSADNNPNVKFGFQWDNNDVSAGSDPSAAFDDITISAATNAPPVAGFTSDVTSGCDSVCVTYTDTSSGANSRVWSFPGGIPSTSTSASQVVCYQSPGNYDVSIIASNSFGDDTVSQSAFVIVAQTPVPDFSVSAQELCVGDCVVYTDLTAGTVQTYDWTFSGGFPVFSNQQNPSFICYLVAGDFSVTLTVLNGTCTNSITRVSYINVHQPPVPVVTLAGDTLISSPALTYQWYELNTGVIPTGIFQNYVALQTGDYYVCTHDGFGCVACSDTIHVDLSNVKELTDAAISIYPNPVSQQLNVRNSNFHLEEISIIDIYGKIIFNVKPVTNSEVKTIDTSALASGVYIVEVQSTGNIYRKKFIKSNSSGE